MISRTLSTPTIESTRTKDGFHYNTHTRSHTYNKQKNLDENSAVGGFSHELISHRGHLGLIHLGFGLGLKSQNYLDVSRLGSP